MRALPLLLLATAAASCRGGGRTPGAAPAADTGTLVVMNAASISRPVRTLLDSFVRARGGTFDQQPGASLEIARWLIDLHRSADVVLLADPAIVPRLLMPEVARWYLVFARNRMVLAYTAESRGADSIDADNWRAVITAPGVEVGRADPNSDPSGYRALLAMQLAARFYGDSGLAERLRRAAPEANVRPREADQIALLEAHQLDYIWTYQSLAEDNGLRYVRLPDQVDLGEPADSAVYRTASVQVAGKHPGETLTVAGEPIVFALTIPTNAAHPGEAARWVADLLSGTGIRLLRDAHVEVLDRPVVVGDGVPEAVAAALQPGPAR
jgi:molybdate/tungstate transport system substrate-binding protein